jgi:hypothetical protein
MNSSVEALTVYDNKLIVGGYFTTAGGKVSPYLARWTKPSYVCGDANGDATADISDVVYLIAYIFSGGPPPNPLAAGNANCDSGIDISDAVYLIAYIFSGGPAPCAGC